MTATNATSVTENPYPPLPGALDRRDYRLFAPLVTAWAAAGLSDTVMAELIGPQVSKVQVLRLRQVRGIASGWRPPTPRADRLAAAEAAAAEAAGEGGAGAAHMPHREVLGDTIEALVDEQMQARRELEAAGQVRPAGAVASCPECRLPVDANLRWAAEEHPSPQSRVVRGVHRFTTCPGSGRRVDWRAPELEVSQSTAGGAR